MCLSNGGDSVEPIRTPPPPQTLQQEAPEAPNRSDNELDSQTNRAAKGTKKYKTEGDLSIGSSPAVAAPTGIKV